MGVFHLKISLLLEYIPQFVLFLLQELILSLQLLHKIMLLRSHLHLGYV